MKQRWHRWGLMLTIALLLGQWLMTDEAWAKKSRSFSSRRSSSGSSSKSRSKGSGFGSSKTTQKSYSSRSDTRSKKGSVFHAKSKTTSRGTSLSDAAKRAESKSKFTSAQQGSQAAKTYKDVVKDNPKLHDALTVEHASTRNQRRVTTYNSLPRANDQYYRYTPTIVYRDPYDNFFFQYVTMTWLFHHWESVDRSRFDDARLRELETKITEMEAQGMQRDPNYVMDGVDPDLQYDDHELNNLQDAKEVLEFEAASEEEHGLSWTTIFLISLVALGGIYFGAVRRY